MTKGKSGAGKMSAHDVRELINKKYGRKVAYDLRDESPTDVHEWIPTGSRWLDSIISKGKKAGVPTGKIIGIAGQESAGKSYLAAMIVKNAQSMGIPCLYFDSESAISPSFFTEIGINLADLIYVQAKSCEFVFETMEAILKEGQQYLFVWDSVPFTPTESELEKDFNPNSEVGKKARVISGGVSRMTDPIADTRSCWVILNQLKTNITNDHFDRMMNPFTTPGGKALKYLYSLEIWLTRRKSKTAYEYDERGFQVGGEVKATIKKSRFGTERRQCAFRILWGDEVKIMDEESWFEAIKNSEHLKSGAWNKLQWEDGTWSENFRSANWLDKLKDDKFRQRVQDLMDEEIIQKFEKREGQASSFYDIDGEGDVPIELPLKEE
jgi:recombination protein RecA